MWRAGVVVVLGACYAPTATPGAPCDPVIDNCPSGLACTLANGEYRCGGDGTGRSDGSLGGEQGTSDAADPTDAVIDASPMIDAPPPLPVTLTYPATVAECINPQAPNTQECKNINGANQVAVDADDSGTGDPWEGFVRFDIDGAPAGKTVTSVALRMTASDDAKVAAPNSGSVWRVSSFTRASLTGTTPVRLDGSPLAGSQGAVSALEVVEWTLPASLVAANSGVYLSIATTNTDGTTYWNLGGPNPPRLVVVAQ